MIWESGVCGRKVRYVLDGYEWFEVVVRAMCAGYNYEIVVQHKKGQTRYYFPYADRSWVEVEQCIDRIVESFRSRLRECPAAFVGGGEDGERY